MYKVMLGRGKGPHFFITDACAQLCKSVHYADYKIPILHPVRAEVHEAAQCGLVDYMASSTPDFCLAWPTRALRRAHLGFLAKGSMCIEPVTEEIKMPEESMTASCDMLRVDLEDVAINKDGMTVGTAIISANMQPEMLDKCISILREGFEMTRQLLAVAKPTCKCEHGNEIKHP